MTINIRGLAGGTVYLGVGLLIYMLLYAPEVFNWASPWVYIVTALWPFALLWEFFVIVIWIMVIALVICFVIMLIDHFC